MTLNEHSPSAAAGRRRCIVVVGPGRSGTSAITRGMAAVGIELGNRLKPAMRKNAKGFFEDLDLLKANYEVHHRLGLRPNGSSVRWLGAGDWARAELEPARHLAAAAIGARFAHHPLWGFKCGGVLRVLPFWEETLEGLGNDIAYIVAIRNPISVSRSRQKLDPHRGIQEKSDLEFLAQIVPYFPRVLARPFVVVDYDELMADPAHQLHRLIERLALPRADGLQSRIDEFASGFVSPSLRHNRASQAELEGSDAANPLTRDAYGLLRRLARDEIDARSPAFLESWSRITERFQGMAPVLQLVDMLEDKLRRRGPGLGGMWRAVSQHMPTAQTLSGLRGRATRAA